MHLLKFGRLAGLAFLASGIAAAGVIDLDSGAGLLTSLAGINTLTINPHELWQPSGPANPGDATDKSAVWISYADTGYMGSFFQPYGGTTPVISVFDNFYSGAGLLHLSVWADDTADVLLDGSYLAHAVFTQGICSGQAIGCTPQDAGQLSAPLTSGSHTLQFNLYQTGPGVGTALNPFGLLFTGTAPTATPEPASAALLLVGLLALGCVRARFSFTR